MATRVETMGEKWIEVKVYNALVKLTVVHSPSLPNPGQRMVVYFTPDEGELLAHAIRAYSKMAAKKEKEK